MTTLFAKTPFLNTKSHPKALSYQFTPGSKLAVSTKKRAISTVRFSCGLIEPDGGKLKELFVDESVKGEKRREGAGLPRVRLTRIDLQWVHVLSEGWASPLGGFMRESEFLQTLHFNSLRLGDGSVVNMSVPIVLAIDDAQKHRIGESTRVALVDSDDRIVAILNE